MGPRLRDETGHFSTSPETAEHLVYVAEATGNNYGSSTSHSGRADLRRFTAVGDTLVP